jgi:hypothetical protein
MLGRYPLATTPLAALAQQAQSISIDVSTTAVAIAVTGSSPQYTVVVGISYTNSNSGSQYPSYLSQPVQLTGSFSGSVFQAQPYEIAYLNYQYSGYYCAAPATAPGLNLSIPQALLIPTAQVVTGSAVSPDLLYSSNLQTATVVTASAYSPSIRPNVNIGITTETNDGGLDPAYLAQPQYISSGSFFDPVFDGQPYNFLYALSSSYYYAALARAYDPTLSIAITTQTIYLPPSTVATASMGSISLIPAVDPGFTTVATGSATAPSLFYNVNPQTTSVITASAYDLSALPNIFLEPSVTTASVGSLSLIPAVDPGFTTVATGSAVSLDLLYNINTNTAYASASVISPALIYNVNLSSASVVTASVYDPSIAPSIFLEPNVATGSVGALDIIPYISLATAYASGTSYSPGLLYSIILSSSHAQATAVDFSNQNVVATDIPTVVSSTVYNPLLIATVVPETGSAYAYAYSPELIYTIIPSTGSANATAVNPGLEYNIALGTTAVASASAYDFSLTGSVFLFSTASLATTVDPGLEYQIIFSTPTVSATVVSPSLELSVILDAPSVVTASAHQLSAFATVLLTPNVAQASASTLNLEYYISLNTLIASATVVNPALVYNVILPTPQIASASIGGISVFRTAGTYHIDPVYGNDTNDGLSWTTPWKTMAFGATPANVIPGDYVKVAKTSDPVSIGCLWTSGSKVVSLSSARTLGLDDCESGWLASSGSTVTHSTYGKKQGSACVSINIPSYTSSSLYAYKEITNTNASAYQELSFWYMVQSGTIDSQRLSLCLCSDVSGSTIVDTFLLPANPAPDRWMPVVTPRSGSGSLGATIRSIALYTTNTPPTSSITLRFDNIQATKTDDLNLTTLISKNSSSIGGQEGYWGIQSISGTTVLLDRDTNCDSNSGYGYYGVTEDVTTYIRNTYKTDPAPFIYSTTMFTVNDSGTSTAPIVFAGGWNTGSNVQDGETYYDGQNGLGIGLYINDKSFISASRMSFYRYGTGLYVSGEAVGLSIGMPNASNNSINAVFVSDKARLNYIEVDNINSNGSPEFTGSSGLVMKDGPMDSTLWIRKSFSNHDSAVLLDSVNGIRLIGTSSIANNPYGVKTINCGAGIFIENTTFKNISVDTSNYSSRLTLVNASMTGSVATHFEHLANYGYTQKTLSHNHDSTGTNLVSHGGGLITSMVTTRPGGSGLMWQLLTSAAHRDSFDPLPLYAGQVYCIANTTTVVKAWLKKDHATQVNGRLAARGRQLAGIPNNITATLANNTDWQELSISLTPTESGLVQIEIWAEYVSGHQAVYYDQGLTIV